MKTYRRHPQHGPRCVLAHRTFAALAACVWRRATVTGEGAFASVSYCNGSVSVHLHEQAQAARDAMATIDRAGCGGFCVRKHDVVRLICPGASA